MSDGIGHWLQLAARVHRARLALAMDDLGIFPGQEQVILHLARDETMTAGALADVLKVRPPTISKTLQRLSAQGLIERRDHAEDARKMTLVLSREGHRRAEALAERLETVEAEMAELFDGKDAKRLRKLLKRVAKGLGSISLADSTDADDVD